MSKPSHRKENSQKKKPQTQVKGSRQKAAKRRIVETFPRVVYAEQNAPRRLVRQVRRTMRYIVENQNNVLPQPLLVFSHLVREIGIASAIARQRAEVGGVLDSRFDGASLALGVGDALFRHFSPQVREWYLPMHDVVVATGQPQENEFLIRFRSLRRVQSAGTRAYCSSQEPRVFLDGTERIVAFTLRAIDWIAERVVYAPERYADNRDLFSFLHACSYFETCVLSDGHPALALYNRIRPGSAEATLYKTMIGENTAKDRLYYLVGYCPVVLTSTHAIATTLLIPGDNCTPEREQHFRGKNLSMQDHCEFARRVSRLKYRGLVKTRDISLIAEFQQAGIPQVKQINEEVFRYVD